MATSSEATRLERPEQMNFIHDHRNPRAVMDEDRVIWVLRSTRDLPHGKAEYLVKWKDENPRSVLADEVLSEQQRIFEVIIDQADLVAKVLPEGTESDVAQLESWLSEAIAIIKKDQYGGLFEKRGINHVVRFR